MTNHHYTLRHRVDARPQVSKRLIAAMGVYALSGCLGWGLIGILIATVMAP